MRPCRCNPLALVTRPGSAIIYCTTTRLHLLVRTDKPICASDAEFSAHFSCSITASCCWAPPSRWPMATPPNRRWRHNKCFLARVEPVGVPLNIAGAIVVAIRYRSVSIGLAKTMFGRPNLPSTRRLVQGWTFLVGSTGISGTALANPPAMAPIRLVSVANPTSRR